MQLRLGRIHLTEVRRENFVCQNEMGKNLALTLGPATHCRLPALTNCIQSLSTMECCPGSDVWQKLECGWCPIVLPIHVLPVALRHFPTAEIISPNANFDLHDFNFQKSPIVSSQKVLRRQVAPPNFGGESVTD